MNMFELVLKIIRCIRINFIILFSFLITDLIIPQVNYEMTLSNGVRVNENTIEFDVLIRSLNDNFSLTSYQCSFLFNQEIANGGQLSFTYIIGSSQLSNLPTFAVGINNTDGEYKLTFASMAGSDLISTTNLVVGRFRLQNSLPMINVDPNIRWSFSGFVSTILTGENFMNITSAVSHTSNLTLNYNSQTNYVPINYKLYQNYPNPFNPNTTIKFDLPEKSNVEISVYNALGQKVNDVLNRTFDAGFHSVDFTSGSLSSGTYFCKLEVDNKYVEIIKMILLK